MALGTQTFSTGDYAWQSWSNGYVISLTLTEESTDVATNTSLVSYLFTISNTNNNRFTESNNSWTISIGGHTISISGFNFNLGTNYTTQTIASGQLTVEHNADGTLDMPYNVSIPNIQAGNRYGPPAMSLSGTWTLTPIPKASSVSCSGGTIGKNVDITIHKASDSFTHTLQYSFEGGVSGTIAENTGLSTVSWTIPETFYGEIPNQKEGTGVIFCTTYNGATPIGESSCTFSAKVDEATSQPDLFAQVIDINAATKALTGDENVLIRYHSTAQALASYWANNLAAVTEYRLSHNGRSYTETPAVIAEVENGQFDFSVTDTRGYTRTLAVSKQVIPYVKLTCNLNDNKPDVDGNMTVFVSGNYFDGALGTESNTLSVWYRYKVSGAAWLDTSEEWHLLTHSVAGNAYTAQAELTGLDYQTAYTFQAKAMDRLAVVSSGEYTVRATPVFDWSEKDVRFHVPVYGITPDMVGARYVSTDGANLLERAGAESGVLFIKDAGDLNHCYFGFFYGYRYGQAATVYSLCAKGLSVITNPYGTITALNATGEVTYSVLPFDSPKN
ncbi:MAG: hypothetical protein E7421_00415 [Ruminococcaceae bacterium]|nr:hypothetical protein [Oscillospiraceae bacterium]